MGRLEPLYGLAPQGRACLGRSSCSRRCQGQVAGAQGLRALCVSAFLTGPWQAAAAAKGATATTSAVAGASGAGSLSKGDGVAGKKGPSPSFDPSTQIGAMAPLGFFDPAGQELQLSRRDVSLPLSPRRIQQEGR